MPCTGGSTLETVAFTQGGSTIFLNMIGYDYFNSDTWHLLLNMHSYPNGNEFMFGLATANRLTKASANTGPGGIVENTFDSNVANSIVPREHRAGVNRVLLQQSERIVRYTNHDSFYMTTYLDGLPVKALAKYDRLCEVFRGCGYDATHSEPRPGKHLWQMNR